jgi:hypothetical protein
MERQMTNKIVIALIVALALGSTIAAIPSAKAEDYDEVRAATAGIVTPIGDPEFATDPSSIQQSFDAPYSRNYGNSYQLNSGFGPQHFSH